MNERNQKAFDFAADATKQLITLSTLIIGFSITFTKEVENLSCFGIKVLFVSWVSYFLCVVFGVGALLKLTGTLGNLKDIRDTQITIYDKGIRTLTFLQILFFLIGVMGTIIYGFTSF